MATGTSGLNLVNVLAFGSALGAKIQQRVVDSGVVPPHLAEKLPFPPQAENPLEGLDGLAGLKDLEGDEELKALLGTPAIAGVTPDQVVNGLEHAAIAAQEWVRDLARSGSAADLKRSVARFAGNAGEKISETLDDPVTVLAILNSSLVPVSVKLSILKKLENSNISDDAYVQTLKNLVLNETDAALVNTALARLERETGSRFASRKAAVAALLEIAKTHEDKALVRRVFATVIKNGADAFDDESEGKVFLFGVLEFVSESDDPVIALTVLEPASQGMDGGEAVLALLIRSLAAKKAEQFAGDAVYGPVFAELKKTVEARLGGGSVEK